MTPQLQAEWMAHVSASGLESRVIQQLQAEWVTHVSMRGLESRDLRQ